MEGVTGFVSSEEKVPDVASHMMYESEQDRLNKEKEMKCKKNSLPAAFFFLLTCLILLLVPSIAVQYVRYSSWRFIALITVLHS